MWQITLEELGADKVKPKRTRNPSGCINYICGICLEPVGIFGPPSYHEQGWLYRRSTCPNGHVVDWEGIE